MSSSFFEDGLAFLQVLALIVSLLAVTGLLVWVVFWNSWFSRLVSVPFLVLVLLTDFFVFGWLFYGLKEVFVGCRR